HYLTRRYNYLLRSSMKEEIEKTTILMAQLNKACSLHNSREYFASITLAGCAESLSEELLTSKDEESYNSFFESVIRKLAEIRGKNSPSKRDILRGKNRVRNSFKHHSKGDSDTITLDMKHESLILIMSALENYSRLGFEQTPVMERFVKRNR
ncbi:hypothetical protein, partial [Vibrio genomosp. F6]